MCWDLFEKTQQHNRCIVVDECTADNRKHSYGWQGKHECQKYDKNNKQRWMSVNTDKVYLVKK